MNVGELIRMLGAFREETEITVLVGHLERIAEFEYIGMTEQEPARVSLRAGKSRPEPAASPTAS